MSDMILPDATASDMEQSHDPIPENIKQYNRAVRLASLSSIILENVEFKVWPEVFSIIRRDLKRDLNVTTDLMGYDPQEGDCAASIVWTILMKHKRKTLVKCRANYVVLYKNMKDCPEDTVKIFIDHVGKTASYAYFRALFAHLDWSANLGSSPLPVVQFQPRIAATIKAQQAARQAKLKPPSGP